MYQPYTYYLYHVPTGKKYYGAEWKYHKNKIANPKNLWVSYFTSSTFVKRLIKRYGRDSFIVEVRKIFSTAEETRAYEDKVLRRLRVTEKKDWLNQSYSSGPFYSTRKGAKLSPEHCSKISKALKGIPRPKSVRQKISKSLKGHTFSSHTLKKMSLAQLGRKRPPRSQEWKDRLSEANKRQVSWCKGKKRGPMSEKQKRNISMARKGPGHRPKWVCKKISEGRKLY